MVRCMLFSVSVLALCTAAWAASWPAGGQDFKEAPLAAVLAANTQLRGSKRAHKPSFAVGKEYAYYHGRDKWEDGHGDFHTSYEHTHEHAGPCISSRQVSAGPTGTRPLNTMCPPPPHPQARECEVPAFCPQDGSLAQCPRREVLRFDAHAAEAHFKNQPGPFHMVDVKQHTFECTDARGEHPMLGTPGGDMGEVIAAAMALMKLGGFGYNHKMADDVFDVFTTHIATPDRPLYFHTDETSLRGLFVYLQDKLGKKPTILPWRGPTGVEGDIWVEALTLPTHNGCGHIRMQLDPTFAKYYSASLSSEAPEVVSCEGGEAKDCIDSAAVAKRIISNYFNYWWFTPSGSLQRFKVAFAVDGPLQDPMLGKAVTTITNKPEAPDAEVCGRYAPLVRPTFSGSRVFVYHADAVTQWRAFVAKTAFGPLVDKYADGRMADFIATWNNVAGMQLEATLTWLVPMNRIGHFDIGIPVKKRELYEVDDEYGEEQRQTPDDDDQGVE